MAEKINGWTISKRTDESGKEIWQAVKNGIVGIAREDYGQVKSWAARYGKDK